MNNNIIIESVGLFNFKCFPPDKLYIQDFDKHLNILSGPNGFGKTTVFDAIELVFSQEITRLEVPENGNKTFETHLLLNDSNKPGLVIIQTIDNNKQVSSYIAIIQAVINRKSNGTIEDSISYYKIDDQEVRNFLMKPSEIEQSISEIEREIESIKKPFINHFNICYYVSQENSTHLLKERINTREEILSPLIGQEEFEKKFSKINEFSLANEKEILKEKIDDTIEDIKKYFIVNKVNEVDFEKLFSQEEFEWDQKKIEQFLSSSTAINKLEQNLKLLRKVIYFKVDLIKKRENDRILALINNKLAIQCYTKLPSEKLSNSSEIDSFVSSGLENISIMEKFSEFKLIIENKDIIKRVNEFTELKEQIQEMNDFLHSKEKYFNSSDNLFSLIKSNEDLISEVEKLDRLYKNLSKEEKIKDDLIEHRNALKEQISSFINIINKTSVHCPLCNKEYDDLERLQNQISQLDKIIDSLSSSIEKEIEEKRITISDLIVKIDNLLTELNIPDKNVLKQKGLYIKIKQDQILNNQILNLANYIREEDIKFTELNSEQITRQLEVRITDYSSEFISEPAFESIEDSFFRFFNCNDLEGVLEKSENLSTSQISKKIEYINYQYGQFKDEKYNELVKKLKVLLKTKKQQEKIIESILSIRKVIKEKETRLKKSIISNIKIPLLVYTAKLLQNYQGGLGVYCDENALRFVSSKGQQDIINRFSSGQLSAFVLTFLLVMNKIYVDSSVAPKFIFIDDPVQTMDDINLSSFIDVLRKEFSDKQIFLSTHEEDKKNYIAYKFIKNGLTVKMFNVKKEWYQIANNE
jgi:exonuclease SbcC